jgi:hypothetical protein
LITAIEFIRLRSRIQELEFGNARESL